MMKAYPNKKSASSRMTRKRARRDVFMYNKTEAKKLRSSLRRQRRLLAESEQQEG
jgi:hypothetical protein